MSPPWQQYPEIPLGSIGWRMGRGEDYWLEFDQWFRSKPAEARASYIEQYPEPPGWDGFYRRKDVQSLPAADRAL